MMEKKEQLWCPKQVADYMQLEVNTLATWRTLGNRNLRWIKIGRAVRYRKSDIDKFIEENLN